MLTSNLCHAQELTPAFPGAEGFGRYTTGGRGGSVYHVTNLNDSGEGSFRWACEQEGRRTIVFDISGTIHLESPIKLVKGNVTIAGQSAPGDGICIADYPFSIGANNVIIRYLRFRLGNDNVTLNGADGWDGLGGMDCSNIIVDHCSVSWSIDECLSIYGVTNATVQWCIAAQSLKNAGHSKGSHGYGGNWGGSGVTYHHNLLAHHESRVPRLGPRQTTQLDERLDMRNNVFYNWAGNGCYGGEGMNVNIVNNYYKPGPATKERDEIIGKRIAGIGIRTTEYCQVKDENNQPTGEWNGWYPMWHVWGKFYVDGNVNSEHDDVTNDNWTYGIYNQINQKDVDNTFDNAVRDSMRLNQPFEFIHVTTHSAEDAYERVLTYAGASKQRDEYDTFIINETKEGKATYTGSGNYKGIINTPNDNKPENAPDNWSPWPALKDSNTEKDTDGDGIPDNWETAHGLNPNNPDDGAETGDDGYTNLEHYLNSLVEDITDGQLAGGKVMGIDRNANNEPIVTEYELSPETYDCTTNGNWTFNNGFSIKPEKGDYSTGTDCGIKGIKYSRNRDYTINIPNGISVTEITITGYCNGDYVEIKDEDGKTVNSDEFQEAYLSELGNETFNADTYPFPSRLSGKCATHNIKLSQPTTESLHFRIGGDNQCVWIITLYPETSTGISNIKVNSNPATGRTYNLQGMEVNEPLQPGIYIRDGKKFIKR